MEDQPVEREAPETKLGVKPASEAPPAGARLPEEVASASLKTVAVEKLAMEAPDASDRPDEA